MYADLEALGLENKVVSPQIVADYIENGWTLAMSGYSMAGYPKEVPQALISRKEKGEDFKFTLITPANVPWLDEVLGGASLISRRIPMIASSVLAKKVNSGEVSYVEQQMCKMPRLLKQKAFGEIDLAIIEIAGFTKDGLLLPTSSLGLNHILMDCAKEIVLEINQSTPKELLGLYDIILEGSLDKLEERQGLIGIPFDKNKVKYVVLSDKQELLEDKPKQINGVSQAITSHLMEFLAKEFEDGVLPPFQTGFGNIAEAIAEGFMQSDFENLRFFSGGVSLSIIELLEKGKAELITTGGIQMTPKVLEILANVKDLKKKLILRNGDIINKSENIEKFNVVALNSAIEVDIYGNVNSSHIGGTRVVNGLGGGANFAENSSISIVLLPSLGKKGLISTIVPMVSHQDICEHDVDIIITENGLADLRGLDDNERAKAIIENCASDSYKDMLKKYLCEAKEKGEAHHIQDPFKAFAWHERLKTTGTMQEEKND